MRRKRIKWNPDWIRRSKTSLFAYDMYYIQKILKMLLENRNRANQQNRNDMSQDMKLIHINLGISLPLNNEKIKKGN